MWIQNLNVTISNPANIKVAVFCFLMTSNRFKFIIIHWWEIAAGWLLEKSLEIV